MSDLLFLAHRLPFPPVKGEKIRAFHELQYLCRHYNIHLGCLMDDPADGAYVDTLRPMCRDLYVAPISRKINRVTCLRGLLTGEALSAAYFRDVGLRRWVRRVIESIRPSVIFVYSSNMAPYILDMPTDASRVVDLVDVDSEKWCALGDATRYPMRFVYQREHRRIAALERRIASECDLSIFVSNAEAALFSQLHPTPTRTKAISNGVDHHYFDPDRHHPPLYDTARPNYVFTGTMDYPPNIDAVTWFATEILPLIRRNLPTAQFHIVGTNPVPSVHRLTKLPGVFVTGRVPDVRPYLAHATASVAPMRIARGMQNKVLEAMAMARPVVLTSNALEGITADPTAEVVVADNQSDFAAACHRVTADATAKAIGIAARRRIIRDYNWAATLAGLDELLRPRQPCKDALR